MFIAETNHFSLAYFTLIYHFNEADIKLTGALLFPLVLLPTFLSFFLETHNQEFVGRGQAN